jgi:MFS family permease
MRRLRLAGGQLIATMCLAEILCMAGFATYPALLSRLASEWSLSNSAAGFIGGVLFLGYVVAVPSLTSLTDRLDARRVYLASTVVAASGSAVFALVADGFWGAILGQVLFGIGFAGIYMPGLKALSDRIPEGQQSRAVALYTSLSGIGLGGSYALAGFAAAHLDWRWGFGLAACGPLCAALLVFLAMAPLPPERGEARPGWLAGFGLVFVNKPALGYVLGYTAHCWELYGARSWLVAYLAFAQAMTTVPGSVAAGLDPAGIVSLISLIGIVTSIYCNEFARRLGRARLVVAIMLASCALSAALGAASLLPFWAAIALASVYYGAIMADSGALTAGTVAAARPGQRGTTLAVHSTFGFSAGLFAPLLFGVILDQAGGAGNRWAWLVGFLSLGLPSLAGAGLIARLSRGATTVTATTPSRAAGGPGRVVS